MAFPTATVTQGSGLTINTLPNAGQATMANSLPVVLANDQSTLAAFVVGGHVDATNSGAITNPASTLTRPASAVASPAAAVPIASPAVFTWTAHPFKNGQTVYLQGTTAPGGFTFLQTYFVVGVATNTFQLAATRGGAAINCTTTAGVGVFATLNYAPNELIASSATAPVVPSFATSAGGALLPRVRLWTSATSGWGGAALSVNLWSAAPTYSAISGNAGDGNPYTVASGGAGWLANFLITLTQFGDAAVGGGGLTGASELALKLASGTSVYWDLQILTGTVQSYPSPIPGQTFNLIAELLN
jgi:hypothetical protein